MLEGIADMFEDAEDWQPEDTNEDGAITGADIPFEPGTLEAKKAWMQVEALSHSPENVAKCKALGYEDGRGMYGGRPLVPGSGPGQGDFDLLRDRLIYHQGYDPEVAQSIAGKARWMTAK